MSSDHAPGDPFGKRPQDGGGSPYDAPGQPPPPGDPYRNPPPGGPVGPGDPYGPGGPVGPGGPGNPGGPGGPYGPGPYGVPGAPDPLAGMPPLAAAGKRLIARLIDIFIVLIPAGLIDWAAGGIQTDDFSSGKSAIGGVLTAVIGFVYEWLMTRSNGQTVGKRLMRLRAAALADGSVPSSGSAAVRALVLWLPAFCCSCFWFVIIGITVLFDRPYKQGLHDKAARTVVVEAV